MKPILDMRTCSYSIGSGPCDELVDHILLVTPQHSITQDLEHRGLWNSKQGKDVLIFTISGSHSFTFILDLPMFDIL